MSGSSPISPVAAAQPITGGSAASGAADDDVLRRVPLQPGRIHDDVEEDREGEQRSRLTLSARARARPRRAARASPKASASCRETLPRGMGRMAVRRP